MEIGQPHTLSTSLLVNWCLSNIGLLIIGHFVRRNEFVDPSLPQQSAVSSLMHDNFSALILVNTVSQPSPMLRSWWVMTIASLWLMAHLTVIWNPKRLIYSIAYKCCIVSVWHTHCPAVQARYHALMLPFLVAYLISFVSFWTQAEGTVIHGTSLSVWTQCTRYMCRPLAWTYQSSLQRLAQRVIAIQILCGQLYIDQCTSITCRQHIQF